MKAPRQKISSASRWLINVGLALQFCVPCVVYLFNIFLMMYTFFTMPPATVGDGGMLVVVYSFVVAGMMIFLILLVGTIVWCTIYLLWDRYGNRFRALCFLIATNMLVSIPWFLMWINAFTTPEDPNFWLLSPAPIAIPTLLYVGALLLLTPKSPQTKSGD